VTRRTRLLLLNTPHNPTGKVFTVQELAAVAELCRERDLVAVTDEVYEYLTYDGRRHHTLAALPGMAQRTLAVSSAGKTFNVTGWKVGWVCGPAPLVAAVRTAKQFLTFAGGTPFQAAVAVALDEPRPWVDELRDSLQHRRDILSSALEDAGVRCCSVEGTYFLQVDSRDFGEPDGERLCRQLPARAGVVAVPSVAFYDTPGAGRSLVRLAFCKPTAVMRAAAVRLARAVPGTAPLPAPRPTLQHTGRPT
jgi:N-succinyldiaminopimelate aminotransferase